MIDRDKLAVIHIAKQACIPGNVAEKEVYYRQMLLDITGKNTAKDLTDQDFYRVMGFFNTLGFSDRAKIKEYYPHSKGYLMTDAQFWKIKGLEAELGWTDQPARLEGFAFRCCKKNVKELDIRAANALIIGLRKLIIFERKKNETKYDHI